MERIFLSPPHMGTFELSFIKEAFESNYIAPLGPMVDAFEREFAEKIGYNHAVAVSSGTAAMHLALRSLNVGPGDEVFVPTLTFIGSVSPIAFQGARPVLIDVDPHTWNIDPKLISNELERCAVEKKLPKAVVPTDLYGQCADYDSIFKCCKKYNVPVVVDAAESLGARYNDSSAGAGAQAAIFSFNGNKIITTSGGGILASDDKSFIDKARYLSQQAKEPFAHYEHLEIGYNYRMSNIVAAIGRGQLGVLDNRVKKKHEIFNYYFDKLNNIPGIEFMPEAPYGRPNHWLTVISISPDKFGVNRETVRLALESENIESRPVWKPLHLQPVFQMREDEAVESKTKEFYNSALKGGKVLCRVVGGKVAEDIFERGLCLPSGTQLSIEDIDRIISIIISCHKKS
jgi:dTDP-4-amino-4,6-dideoxygalactose transaminase